MKKLKLIKFFLGITTLLIALGYLFSIWYSAPIKVYEHFSNITITMLSIPLVLSVIAGGLNAQLWFRINNNLDKSIKFRPSYLAWSVGRIYRYIPGKITGYYMRNKLQSTSIKEGALASLSEYILTLLPIIFLLIVYLITASASLWIIIVFSILFTLLYYSKPIILAIPKMSDILSSYEKILYSPKEMTDKFKFILPAMLLHGLSFYFIIKIGLNESSIDLYQAIVALYVSGIISQLAFISPGGLGVREAAIVILLSTFGVNEDIAISAAIISRIILIISELSNVVIAFLLNKAK